MSQDTKTLIDQFAAGPEKLKQSTRGLSRDEALRVPPADAGPGIGKWSIQQVILHLADAQAAFADRVKRLIAEDSPTLLEWSENRFAERLFYEEQSADDAVELIDLTRRQLVKVLRKLPDTAFNRAGTHSSRGKQTLAEVIGFDVWHLEHHLKFIDAKRKLFGK